MVCPIYAPLYDWCLDMSVFYSESKTDLKLWCDSCTNSSYSGVPRRLTAVCCMLLPHKSHRLPQHYKRHICWPFYSCKYRYLWVSPIFERYFCLNCMATVRHLTTFLAKQEFLLHRPVFVFQPTVNSRASDNRSKQCQNHICELGKMCSYEKCRHICRCLWRGLGGGGDTFWLLYENLTFKGPEALQATAFNRVGVNKIAPNLDTQFATYICCSALRD
jgi:hypothetical protein